MNRSGSKKTVTSGATVTLKTVLARVPELRTLYQSTFGERSWCVATSPHPAQDYDRRGYYFEILDRSWNEQELRDLLRLPSEASFAAVYLPKMLSEIRDNPTLWLSHAEGETLPVSVKSDPDGYQFLVAPLADGTDLSSLLSLFTVAYASGMLVRYYPPPGST